MKHSKWTSADIPSQIGKIIVITGANSGLGFEAARVLSEKGATVILAVRNIGKGKDAYDRIKIENPEAKLKVLELDLNDFGSIINFAATFKEHFQHLHVLINNAGVMAPSKRTFTKQGFEVQFGVNHLGHYLLTGHLLDILDRTPESRVVTQSSVVHKQKQYGAEIFFNDLNFEKKYNKNFAYGQSKLANLLFTYELDRLFKQHQIDCIATAAHPGYTATSLQSHYGFFVRVILNFLFAQKVSIGALAILRAATQEDLKGSEFFGPNRWGEIKGHPVRLKSSDRSYDRPLARKLWEISEQLAQYKYGFHLLQD